MDPTYEPPEMETRTLFGLQMQQKRNDAVIRSEMFKNVVTKTKDVSNNLGYVQRIWARPQNQIA